MLGRRASTRCYGRLPSGGRVCTPPGNPSSVTDGSSAREQVVRTRWGTLGRPRAGFTGLEQSSGARSEVQTPLRVIGAVVRGGSLPCGVLCAANIPLGC